MLYIIGAIIIIGLIVAGILVYRRHQEPIEKAVDKVEQVVKDTTDAVKK
jgi:uncharacterized protein YpmB